MEETPINFLAIAAAAILSYAFGAVYYMVLSNQWMSALGKTRETIKADGGNSPGIFVSAFLAQIVMAFVMARFIVLLDTDGNGLETGLTVALYAWAGFVLTTLIVNHGFQGAKRSLTLVDSGHWLGVLLIQGIVLGLFGH